VVDIEQIDELLHPLLYLHHILYSSCLYGVAAFSAHSVAKRLFVYIKENDTFGKETGRREAVQLQKGVYFDIFVNIGVGDTRNEGSVAQYQPLQIGPDHPLGMFRTIGKKEQNLAACLKVSLLEQNGSYLFAELCSARLFCDDRTGKEFGETLYLALRKLYTFYGLFYYAVDFGRKQMGAGCVVLQYGSYDGGAYEGRNRLPRAAP